LPGERSSTVALLLGMSRRTLAEQFMGLFRVPTDAVLTGRHFAMISDDGKFCFNYYCPL
jgi:hypothetical protein